MGIQSEPAIALIVAVALFPIILAAILSLLLQVSFPPG